MVSHLSIFAMFFSHGSIEKHIVLDHDDIFVNPYLEGDPDEIISEDDLPFTRFKLPPEEEEVGSIQTSTFVPKTYHHHLDIKFTLLNTISTSMGCGYSKPASYHRHAQVRCLRFPLPTMCPAFVCF